MYLLYAFSNRVVYYFLRFVLNIQRFSSRPT